MEFKNTPFIFYLSLEDELPSKYYFLDAKLKDHGFTLMPIKVDQLQAIISASIQEHIIILTSVSNSIEYKNYNNNVRKFLKNALKSRRTSFFLISSFSKINDRKNLTQIENYYFLKYPICGESFGMHLSNYYKAKSANSSLWPGGKRATLEDM